MKLSEHRLNEYRIIVIDNAGFHSTKDFEIPKNIFLWRIPPYSPELNPCEQVWAYIKQRFKNQQFEKISEIKQWLHDMVKEMNHDLIKSIVSNHHYLDSFSAIFNI